VKISPGERGGGSGTKGIYERNRKVYTLYKEVFISILKLEKAVLGNS
jgi:hypothetical protein